jgi:methyl-accepting chemotaxis protein
MDFQVDTSYLTDARNKKTGHVEIVQNITELIKTQKESEALLEEMRIKNEKEANLIKDINEVSNSFVQASENIVNSAKMLADNSTMQTSSIGKLYESISEIAQKTKNNTDNANKAAELASRVKNDALKGSEQMEKLTNAVKEINESTQAISKVISLIEAISSQTDILALNAAIEAARAGEAGRGFAIVADEVSKLATQSTNSVRETNTFIEHSVEKAIVGVDIAKATAAALQEIVTGIDANTQLSKEIVDLSKEQSEAIDMINAEIEQVLQSVQQNAATAEEFAAESEAMKDRSSTLKQLTEDFGNM